ncbi:hypothetical protein [Longimicrobium sp.]|jgi:hypothetical protein|uniref:hypothetical protein n=1 Tax=Longimicrobium sp. TaxID=2029185 RepID=UPI002ED97F08
MSTKELEMVPVTSEEVSPEEYLRIHEKDRGLIQSVGIRGPSLGRPGFGQIVVEYKTPIYRYRLGGRLG